MGLGITELLVILLVVLVVFGAGKLSGVGKAVGKSVREFKDEVSTSDDGKKEEQTATQKDNE